VKRNDPGLELKGFAGGDDDSTDLIPGASLPSRFRQSLVLAALMTSTGCGSSGFSSVSHRHSPRSEARIVVLPVTLPSALKLPPKEERTLGALCANELLRAYEVLELERFERMLAEKKLKLGDVLKQGTGKMAAEEMGVEALLVSEIYSWRPGKPGLLFLAKDGSIGFQGRLIDLASGSLIWSVNHVMPTSPSEPLPVAASRVFDVLVDEMPRGAAAF
jgi:hypothetical protein